MSYKIEDFTDVFNQLQIVIASDHYHSLEDKYSFPKSHPLHKYVKFILRSEEIEIAFNPKELIELDSLWKTSWYVTTPEELTNDLLEITNLILLAEVMDI